MHSTRVNILIQTAMVLRYQNLPDLQGTCGLAFHGVLFPVSSLDFGLQRGAEIDFQQQILIVQSRLVIIFHREMAVYTMVWGVA